MLKVVTTISSQRFLDNIKNEIDANNIRTWEVDKDGDFTHTSEQWKNKAWVKVQNINNDSLEFSLLGTKQNGLTDEIAGAYYGNFSQMLIAHFNKDFSHLEIKS